MPFGFGIRRAAKRRGLTASYAAAVAASLPYGWSVARVGAADYIDSTGATQSAPANTPRITYDATTHALRGLLLEATPLMETLTISGLQLFGFVDGQSYICTRIYDDSATNTNTVTVTNGYIQLTGIDNGRAIKGVSIVPAPNQADFRIFAPTPNATVENNSGVTSFLFNVMRVGSAVGTATIDWSVSGDVDAADFGGTIPSGTLVFQGGETVKVISIEVTGDLLDEDDEVFTVTLSNASDGSISEPVAYATVLDDDTPPPAEWDISANTSQQAEGNSGTVEYIFSVSRQLNTIGDASIEWSVSGAGANQASPNDFEGNIYPSGVIDFVDGQAANTFSVFVKGDTTFEQNETFRVTISNPSTGLIVTTFVDVIITNDDAPPAARFAISQTSMALSEGSSGSTVYTYTITRTVNTTGSASVEWSVAGFGANPANQSDFVGGVFPLGTANFTDGISSVDISFSVNSDIILEQDESFIVTIANPSIGTIITPTVTGTILNDDSMTGGAMSFNNPASSGLLLLLFDD